MVYHLKAGISQEAAQFRKKQEVHADPVGEAPTEGDDRAMLKPHMGRNKKEFEIHILSFINVPFTMKIRTAIRQSAYETPCMCRNSQLSTNHASITSNLPSLKNRKVGRKACGRSTVSLH